MIAILAISFSGTQNSGAGEPLSATPSPVKAAPEHCPSVIAAVRFYSRRLNEWKVRMGAGSTLKPRRLTACPRYLAKVLRAKTYAAHKAYERWHDYQYAWSHWLPQKWVRIGICETGLNWQHSNSSYEGAFGFALQSWDSFVPRANPKAGPYPPNAYMATPRQQYEVALAIYRMFGFSGWGCRNA